MNIEPLVFSPFWASGPLRIRDWQVERVIDSLSLALDLASCRVFLEDKEYAEWMDRVGARLTAASGVGSATLGNGLESIALAIVGQSAAELRGGAR